jgi:rhodanese-related sulfurtransferase
VQSISVLFGIFLLGIACGIVCALFFDTVRYTEYYPPVMDSRDPKVVYDAIQKSAPGSYLFLDVRNEAEYQKIHAELSENQPIHTLFDLWRDLPRDKNTPIYLICSGGRLAGVAYGFLQLHGFQNIVHVAGGIQEWVANDLPTVSPSLF